MPGLLINGTKGIAVGMATSILPHNIKEVIQGTLALQKNPEITVGELMQYIRAPDFPTGGTIMGLEGIAKAYHTGHGRAIVKAKCSIEEDPNSSRQSIVATELPYMVNKARLVEHIALLVKEKKLEGISELRDESDKDGIRVVVILKQNEIAQVILNRLYKFTALETSLPINTIAIVEGRPKTLNLKEILNAFLKHRREIVLRRSQFELRKARERTHTLEGLAVALGNIDEIIELIKKSQTPQNARNALLEKVWQPSSSIEMLQKDVFTLTRLPEIPAQYGLTEKGYCLSEEQVRAILDMRLQRLTALEKDKIFNEFRELVTAIRKLLDILATPTSLMKVIRKELQEAEREFGDERKTEIIEQYHEMTAEDYVPNEEVVVTLSHMGYTKCQPTEVYQAQKRGGKGKSASKVKEKDFIDTMFIANMHDTLLCFTSFGRVYWCKVYQLPKVSRTSRGSPIVNILSLQQDEKVTNILVIDEFTEGKFVFLATQLGIVKKVALEAFSRPRINGIIGINLQDEDKMIAAEIVENDCDVMLFSNVGKAIRFPSASVRSTGRTARGIRGIRLGELQNVVSLICLSPQDIGTTSVLIATENGYGKRTKCEAFFIPAARWYWLDRHQDQQKKWQSHRCSCS